MRSHDFLTIKFEYFKKTKLYKKIKYAPSVIIVNNGKIIDYLDSNKNEDLTVKAMELMTDMIYKLIRESFKGSYYIKAIDCIKAFRDAANDEDEIDLFNSFLIFMVFLISKSFSLF